MQLLQRFRKASLDFFVVRGRGPEFVHRIAGSGDQVDEVIEPGLTAFDQGGG